MGSEMCIRDSLIREKVRELTQDWSWIACGALVVALRDQCYYVIDGQHRLMAAKRRSDIAEMPCVVFQLDGIQEEAKGFVSVNCSRRPVSVQNRHKAMVVSGDKIAQMVQQQLDKLGLSSTCDKKNPHYFVCFKWALQAAESDYDAFCEILKLATEISLKDSEPMKHALLQGLEYINKHYPGGIKEPRIAERIKQKRCFCFEPSSQQSSCTKRHRRQKSVGQGYS